MHDNGVGIPALFATPDEAGVNAPAPAYYGIGLANVSDRVQRLYGSAAHLRLTSGTETGTTAELLLPIEEVKMFNSQLSSVNGQEPENPVSH